MRRRCSLRLPLIGMAALQLLLEPARAADLPTIKAPPAPPPAAFTWTGLHLGADFGYTWSPSPQITAASANLYDLTAFSWGPASALSASGVVSSNLDGFLAGGGLGYDWQFTDRFVAGLEADLQGAGARGGGGLRNIVPNPNALGLAAFAVTGAKLNRNLEYLGTTRARLGYAVTPNLLAYATGGLAFGGVNEIASFRQNAAPSLLSSGSAKGSAFENSVGWTAGAGVEYAFTRQLSAKFEYLYYDLGSMTLTNANINPIILQGILGLPLFVANATNVSTRFDGHLVRAGLNYRLDWSQPEPSASGATPLLASPRLALTPAPTLGDWRLSFAPYSWALGINGSVTALGETVGADLSFIDFLTKTSAFPLNFAGRGEANNGPFGVYGDLIWMQLRAGGSTLQLRSPLTDVSVAASADGHLKLTMAIGEAGVTYELARWKFLGAQSSFTSLDVYAGMRYWFVDLDLQLDVTGAAASQIPGLDVSRAGGLGVAKSGALQWVDPVIGLRARHEFAPGERFETRGDIGGFGAGSAFSWEVYGGYAHDFEFNGLKLTSSIGYRALSVDYSKTNNNGRENGVNAVLHGPLVSVGLRF